MASCIASITTMRSMDFSRATASAICNSSRRFALTAISVGLLGVVIVGVGIFDRFGLVVVDGVQLLVGAGHVHELVGHHQLGLGNGREAELVIGIGTA